MKINVSRICLKRVTGMKTFQMRLKKIVKRNKVNVSRTCPKSLTETKTFRTRMKIKVKTNENQRVSDLSKTRHRKENIPNADENKSKNY